MSTLLKFFFISFGVLLCGGCTSISEPKETYRVLLQLYEKDTMIESLALYMTSSSNITKDWSHVRIAPEQGYYYGISEENLRRGQFSWNAKTDEVSVMGIGSRFDLSLGNYDVDTNSFDLSIKYQYRTSKEVMLDKDNILSEQLLINTADSKTDEYLKSYFPHPQTNMMRTKISIPDLGIMMDNKIFPQIKLGETLEWQLPEDYKLLLRIDSYR